VNAIASFLRSSLMRKKAAMAATGKVLKALLLY
jgi:hypothetical protein